MKKNSFYSIIAIQILLMLFCSSLHSIAQDTTATPRPKTFKAFANTGKLIRGYLIALGDSSVLLSTTRAPYNTVPIPGNYQEISYRDLQSLKLHRRNAGAKGAWIGGLSLMVVGVVTGFIAGDDKPVPYDPANDPLGIGALTLAFQNMGNMTAGQKAVAGGAVGLVVGTIVGAVVGSLVMRKFSTRGNKEKYVDMKTKMLSKVYFKQQ